MYGEISNLVAFLFSPQRGYYNVVGFGAGEEQCTAADISWSMEKFHRVGSAAADGRKYVLGPKRLVSAYGNAQRII